MSSVSAAPRRRADRRRAEIVEPAIPSALTAWDRVKLARHPDRPHTLDYIDELTTDFVELHGDRSLRRRPGADRRPGQLRRPHGAGARPPEGRETPARISSRNFGMARPEGYRKAERLMRHAEKFGLPIITFIDTPGAEPGIGSEERGQGTAIAESLLTMAGLRDADRRGRDRRGRQRRRAGDRRGRPRADAGERGLLGRLARGLRLDPLEGCRPRPPEAAETMRITAPISRVRHHRRDRPEEHARPRAPARGHRRRRRSDRPPPRRSACARSSRTKRHRRAHRAPLREIPPHRRLDGIG